MHPRVAALPKSVRDTLLYDSVRSLHHDLKRPLEAEPYQTYDEHNTVQLVRTVLFWAGRRSDLLGVFSNNAEDAEAYMEALIDWAERQDVQKGLQGVGGSFPPGEP